MSSAAVRIQPSRIHPSRINRPVASPASGLRASSEAWGSVRLTSRGRLVVLLVVLAIAFVAFTMVGDPAVSTDAPHHPSAEQVVVEPGQTLWDIAGRVAPSEDPRTVIADIVDLNALDSGGSIRAGQPLFVPQY